MTAFVLRIAAALITLIIGISATNLWNLLDNSSAPQIANSRTQEDLNLAANKSNFIAEQEIREIYYQYDIAQTNLDASFFEKMEADSFILTTSSGRTYTKTQAIALLKTFEKGVKYRTDDLNIQFSGNLAVVRGQMTATHLGTEDQYSSQWYWVDLFMKHNGRWQILSTTQVN